MDVCAAVCGVYRRQSRKEEIVNSRGDGSNSDCRIIEFDLFL